MERKVDQAIGWVPIAYYGYTTDWDLRGRALATGGRAMGRRSGLSKY